ncbi:MAG TPA: Type 1 glutamine amidotransferase-like domain-containing protein [Anaerolineales bacterium]|nr:Type 1 glutamine amidotransferase-like domain-containing protein [Anaerolineales bacterium]
MHLHLFSTPGDKDIRYVVEASRPYLSGKSEATIAFLPQAWLNVNYWLDYTARQFDGLARIELIDTERMDLTDMETIIRRAQLVYISGGNTFLLNHRLHISRLMPYLKKKVQSGLPVIGFSAGMILCGPNILTASDLNSVGTSYFDGLNVSPFNFFAHYATDSYGQAIQDGWLSDYHVFNENPVILLSDGAYLKVEGKKTTLVRGEAWILRKEQEKERLEERKIIHL